MITSGCPRKRQRAAALQDASRGTRTLNHASRLGVLQSSGALGVLIVGFFGAKKMAGKMPSCLNLAQASHLHYAHFFV